MPCDKNGMPVHDVQPVHVRGAASAIVHGLARCALRLVLHAHERVVGGGQGGAIQQDVTSGGALRGRRGRRGRRAGRRDGGLVGHGLADDGDAEVGLEGGQVGVGGIHASFEGIGVARHFDVDVENQGTARGEAVDAGLFHLYV